MIVISQEKDVCPLCGGEGVCAYMRGMKDGPNPYDSTVLEWEEQCEECRDTGKVSASSS